MTEIIFGIRLWRIPRAIGEPSRFRETRRGSTVASKEELGTIDNTTGKI
jgi:hypothetical protein